MGGKWLGGTSIAKRKGQLAADKERLRLERELGIDKLRLDLALRKADWIDESRRLANRSYFEGLEVCAQLKE